MCLCRDDNGYTNTDIHHTYICIYTCVYVCVHTSVYIYIYIVYIHIYIYIQAHSKNGQTKRYIDRQCMCMRFVALASLQVEQTSL